MLRVLDRAREIYGARGAWATLVMGLRKVTSPVVTIGSVWFLDCDLSEGLPSVRPVPGILAREAFLSDIDLLDGTEDAEQRKADAIERFARGDRWFVGIDASNGRLANYRWVTTAWELIPELGRNVVPQAGETFIYALYTLPEYRRRGIDSFTRQYTYDLLHRTSGIRRVLASIFDDNHASFRASRMFLKRIGRVWYVTFRGCRPLVFVPHDPRMPTLALADR